MWLYRTNRREACFNMASDNTRKLMLAKVLNSARAANILDVNDSIASEVWLLIILQQFLLLKERMPLMERMKAMKTTLKWWVRAEETWKPRTQIQKKTAILNQAVGVLTIQKTPYLTMKASLTTLCHRLKLTLRITWLNSDTELLKVQNFQCKCKLRAEFRETSTLAHCEKPGCIPQFSTDEILARRLNVAEFNEGEVVFIVV